MSHFNTYGKMALSDVDDVIQNGRYYSQAEAEKLMPADICRKLSCHEGDSFLDVGCGTGVNLKEFLKYSKDCAACDHDNVLEKLKKKPDFSEVSFYAGDFLEIDFDRSFSKVLIYGVAPVLPDEETLLAVIEKGVSVMRDDGLLLIGDISNVDKKSRFLASKRGQDFQKQWEKDQENSCPSPIQNFMDPEDNKAVTITDETVFKILQHYRSLGYNTSLLSQPQDLPFGNTREDILIIGPEYKDR